MKLGITGHRAFADAETERWVRQTLTAELHSLAPVCGFTSLAAGADQMFAQALLDAGVPFVALIPCAGYARTFSADELVAYERLRSAAARVEVLPHPEPSAEAFFAAGVAVLDACDLLVTVWDGLPARGRGGTGEIVQLALSRGTPVAHLHPRDATVTRLTAPYLPQPKLPPQDLP